MRREHHPFWVQQLVSTATRMWAQHFLVPQFDRIGLDPRFAGVRHIHLQGKNIRVGDHLHVFAAPHAPVSFSVEPYEQGEGKGEIAIGDFCVLSPGLRVRAATSVRVGSNCMFAEHCLVTDSDWHDLYHRIYPGKSAPVAIGNNVWLGDSVTVGKGVTIGDNSVIGACAVVTRDVPPNTIAAGNPAKPIGELDPSRASSRREHLFASVRSYEAFKAEYDRNRLAGNTLRGWLRARLAPTRDS